MSNRAKDIKRHPGKYLGVRKVLFNKPTHIQGQAWDNDEHLIVETGRGVVRIKKSSIIFDDYGDEKSD